TGNYSTSDHETFAYDALGEVLTRQDLAGATHSSSYDVLGRLRTQGITTTDGSGSPSTQFTYDVLGNIASQTDPRGNTTTLDHDSLGRLVQQVLPDPDGLSGNPTTAYTYDAAG